MTETKIYFGYMDLGISDDNMDTNIYWIYTCYPVHVTYGSLVNHLHFGMGKSE